MEREAKVKTILKPENLLDLPPALQKCVHHEQCYKKNGVSTYRETPYVLTGKLFLFLLPGMSIAR